MAEEQQGYEMSVEQEMSEHDKLIQIKELTVMRKVREAQTETEELNQLKREKALLDQYREDRKPKKAPECSEGDGRPVVAHGLCSRCYKRAQRLAKKEARKRAGRTPFYGTEEL